MTCFVAACGCVCRCAAVQTLDRWRAPWPSLARLLHQADVTTIIHPSNALAQPASLLDRMRTPRNAPCHSKRPPAGVTLQPAGVMIHAACLKYGDTLSLLCTPHPQQVRADELQSVRCLFGTQAVALIANASTIQQASKQLQPVERRLAVNSCTASLCLQLFREQHRADENGTPRHGCGCFPVAAAGAANPSSRRTKPDRLAPAEHRARARQL